MNNISVKVNNNDSESNSNKSIKDQVYKEASLLLIGYYLLL